VSSGTLYLAQPTNQSDCTKCQFCPMFLVAENFTMSWILGHLWHYNAIRFTAGFSVWFTEFFSESSAMNFNCWSFCTCIFLYSWFEIFLCCCAFLSFVVNKQLKYSVVFLKIIISLLHELLVWGMLNFVWSEYFLRLMFGLLFSNAGYGLCCYDHFLC